jgi:hypothetical protein
MDIFLTYRQLTITQIWICLVLFERHQQLLPKQVPINPNLTRMKQVAPPSSSLVMPKSDMLHF